MPSLRRLWRLLQNTIRKRHARSRAGSGRHIVAILACLLGCIIVDQLRRDNNNVPIATVWRQLSHWSPSLESDATVRADYALTTPMIIVDRLL